MGSKRKGNSIDKNSDEYRQKRQKNNNAVKRSRDKTKQKASEASERVTKLLVENENLRSTVDNMTQELQMLKDMLICQAGSVNLNDYLKPETEACIEELLRDDAQPDLDRISNVLLEMRKIQNMHNDDYDG